MKTQLMIAAFMGMSVAFAQELAQQEGVAPVTEAAAEASVQNANEDAEIVIDADDKIQEAFDAFIAAKADAGFSSYGKAHPQSGIIYYAELAPVGGAGPKDPEFLVKRQQAFMLAYRKIRNSYVKYSLESKSQSQSEYEFLEDKDAEGAQTQESLSQIERLAKKTMALAESALDRKLESAGLSPDRFSSAQSKRKALMEKLITESAIHAFSSCSGISVVKTIEARGDDGGYSIGVIAKYDPMFEYYADCFARQIRPQASNPGIDVGLMLKGDISQNFGTRFYYDEEGMPALVSFGQYAVIQTETDRRAQKARETGAFAEAERLAIESMNDFIAGNVTYDEAGKGGEEFCKSIAYDENGLPVMSSIEDSISKFNNIKSKSKAAVSMAGRNVVVRKFVAHPDTKQKVAVVAVTWSFAKLAADQKGANIRRDKGRSHAKTKAEEESSASANGNKRSSQSVVREGQTYDF